MAQVQEAATAPSAQSTSRLGADAFFKWLTITAALVVPIIMTGIFWELLSLSWLALKKFGWHFFVSQTWNPVTQVFGAASSIYGTIVSTLIAMVLAVPMSIVIALFLVELAPPRLSKVVGTLIELLAAIPSIIYGMWGLFVFAPFMAKYVQPVLGKYLGFLPLFQGPPMGIGMFTAGIILAFMILPFITAICRDVFALVPAVLKESGYGVGATTWEVTYKITIPYGIVGVFGGVFLGLGRALGETMAVTFVIGNTHKIALSLFSPGNSIASCLANEFAEATEPIYLSSLIALGLVLFVFTFIVQSYLSGYVAPHVSRLEHKNMIPRAAAGRRLINLLVSITASLAALTGIFILLWITLMLAYKGLPALGIDFFTHLPTPPMVPGGGLANAILGTLLLTVLATLMAVPVGLLAGICLGEFGHRSKLADLSRFAANVLTGMPSIIVGIFVYGMLVLTLGHFSGFAGAIALAIIMLPVVARTTEDMLRLVPDPLRESALAMGAPRWRVILFIVFRAASSGIITGILLGVARVSGETAPLLFTALNSPYMMSSLFQPMPNLTVTIFNYAMSPYEDWQRLAWGASMLITAAVLALNLLARFVFKEKTR